MKRKLLFTALCVVSALGFKANAQETPTNDGVYYMYNQESGLFLSRGNDWGTQAVAKPVGLPWKVSLADGKYTLRMYDLTVAGSTSGFGDNAFTDNGSPIEFTPIAGNDGGYKLQNGSNYITCPENAGVVTLSTTQSEWQFLTQAQYDAVLAAKVAAQEAAIATAKGIVIPDGQSLNDVVSDPDNWAVSATVNDGVPTTEKWTATNHTNRGNQYINWGNYGSEMYQVCNGHYTRTITGLKKGIYKIYIRGMKRIGSNANCVTMGNAGWKVTDTYMSANGNIIRFKSWYEDKAGDANPNNTGQFVDIVNNGGYITEGFAYVGDDGNLSLDASSEAYWGYGWFLFNGISYTFYDNEVSDDDATTILAQADALLLEEMDATIKSNLSDARTTFDGERTIANYNALNTAIEAAQTSADAYAAFAPERAKAIALGMEEATVNSYAPNVQNLMVAEYTYVTTTYPYAVDLGEWTKTNATDRTGQHWDNNPSSPYSEQNEGWGATSWSCSYSQDLLLPAGSYVFKVAGRKSSDSAALTLTVKSGATTLGTVNDFPNGDLGKGIDTSGATNFGDGTFANGGTGRGWQWRYVKFTLGEDATVTISITGNATARYQWVGFCNPTVQADNDDVVDILEYNIAKASAIIVRDDAQFKNVTGSERTALINAINADPTSDYPAATAALNNASAAVIAAAPTYDTFVELNPTVASTLGVAMPSITSSTTAADLDVEGIIVDEYTAAMDYDEDYTSRLDDWTNAPGNTQGQSWDNTDSDSYYDEYSQVDRAMTQTVTLPAGDYALIAKGRASANGRLTVTVGGETVTFAHKGASGYGIATNGDATFADNAIYANNGNGWGWEYRVITFTSDGTTPTTLTFNWTTASDNWCSLDDIELLCNPAALDYSVLQTAYDAVEVPTLGFLDGEYAPYNNAVNLANIKAAEEMLDNEDATNQNEIDDLAAAITGMTWTANVGEINAFYDGDFSECAEDDASPLDYTPAGWTPSNNFRLMLKNTETYPGLVDASAETATMSWSGGITYGEQPGYEMPLKANTVYTLKLKAAGWNDETRSGIRVSILNGIDGVDLYDMGTPDRDIKAAQPWNTAGMTSYEIVFATGAAGNYVFHVESGNNMVLSDFEIKKAASQELAFDEDEDMPAYAPGIYPTVSLTRTIKAGINTVVLPFDMTQGEVESTFGVGSIVYVISDYNSEDDNVTFIEQDGIYANEPVLVKATVASYDTYTFGDFEVAAPATTPESIVANGLKMVGNYNPAAYIPASEGSVANYVVSNGALYEVDVNNSVAIRSTRAYFSLTAPEAAKSLKMTFGGEASNVDAPEVVETEEPEVLFNMAGIQVGKDFKGVVINHKGEKRLQNK